MPKVLNRRTDTISPDAVYVGRPSEWGNPFIAGKDGTREEVINKYRDWLLYGDGSWRLKYIGELRGLDLVCWCAPLPCHADVLLELANKEVMENG